MNSRSRTVSQAAIQAQPQWCAHQVRPGSPAAWTGTFATATPIRLATTASHFPGSSDTEQASPAAPAVEHGSSPPPHSIPSHTAMHPTVPVPASTATAAPPSSLAPAVTPESSPPSRDPTTSATSPPPPLLPTARPSPRSRTSMGGGGSGVSQLATGQETLCATPLEVRPSPRGPGTGTPRARSSVAATSGCQRGSRR